MRKETPQQKMDRLSGQERLFSSVTIASSVFAVLGAALLSKEDFQTLNDIVSRRHNPEVGNTTFLTALSGVTMMLNAVAYLGTRRVRKIFESQQNEIKNQGQ